MSSNSLAALIVVGILLLLIGAGMPSQRTVTTETCSDNFWVGDTYVEGNCYQGQVTASNPAKGAVTGFGALILLIGIVGMGVSSVKSGGGGRVTSQTSSPLLRVSSDVIDAESNETKTVTQEVRANNVQTATNQFEQSCVESGYVVDGDPTVEVVSTAEPADSTSSTTDTYTEQDSEPDDWTKRPIHELVMSWMQSVDKKIWDYVIKGGIIVLGANVLIRNNWLPSDAFLLTIVFWLLLPVAIFMDSRYTAEATEWNPSQVIWTIGAMLPQLNFIVGTLYLIRRRYALQQRKFELSVIQTDLKQGYSRVYRWLEG